MLNAAHHSRTGCRQCLQQQHIGCWNASSTTRATPECQITRQERDLAAAPGSKPHLACIHRHVGSMSSSSSIMWDAGVTGVNPRARNHNQAARFASNTSIRVSGCNVTIVYSAARTAGAWDAHCLASQLVRMQA
jgi:hypothetical protein